MPRYVEEREYLVYGTIILMPAISVVICTLQAQQPIPIPSVPDETIARLFI
jgi:hypothetical protein